MEETVQQYVKPKRKIVPDAEAKSGKVPKVTGCKPLRFQKPVNARACGLREKGVRLKKFPRAPAFGRHRVTATR